ncbi:DMT family transporter [Leekyejoonella antrihumi]|uniref:DMT family transporter n=1 Tax=Leekyejoonella antrihumi TaxID=1660198 RepID=A0A563DTL4_9MICO|nr:DMT family transporter [Leekyejoonella antrihumi]TWP33585.1 DMT family transporter [Leekyejoonella antrihumi]
MLALLALASSAVWGTSDFAGGWFSKRIAALRVVTLSQLGGLLVMSVVIAVALGEGAISAPHWPAGWAVYGVLSGVTGAAGLTCFYAALSSGTMGVVSPIAALGAVVPVTLGLLTGDSIGPVVAAGLTLALLGAALASGPELSGEVSRRPVLLAVVAAFGFGLSLFFLDRGAADSVVGSLWAMRVASVGVLALTWALWPGGLPGKGADHRDLLPLLIVGAGDLGANVLFAVSTAYGQVSVASVLGSLYPVMTLLLARFVLHERMRPIQSAGVALAMLGVVLTAAF